MTDIETQLKLKQEEIKENPDQNQRNLLPKSTRLEAKITENVLTIIFPAVQNVFRKSKNDWAKSNCPTKSPETTNCELFSRFPFCI